MSDPYKIQPHRTGIDPAHRDSDRTVLGYSPGTTEMLRTLQTRIGIMLSQPMPRLSPSSQEPSIHDTRFDIIIGNVGLKDLSKAEPTPKALPGSDQWPNTTVRHLDEHVSEVVKFGDSSIPPSFPPSITVESVSEPERVDPNPAKTIQEMKWRLENSPDIEKRTAILNHIAKSYPREEIEAALARRSSPKEPVLPEPGTDMVDAAFRTWWDAFIKEVGNFSPEPWISYRAGYEAGRKG